MTTVPSRAGIVAVVGAAAAVGAAAGRRLAAAGYRVITAGMRDAKVTGDLGTDEGRRDAGRRPTRLAHGALDDTHSGGRRR
jgi:hypothetical protein